MGNLLRQWWHVPGMILLVAAVLFAGDWVIFHWRSSHGSAIGIVTVEQYMQVLLKGNKVELNYIGTTDVHCTRSLFPQRIDSDWTAPCWWRERHRKIWLEAATPIQVPLRLPDSDPSMADRWLET